MYDYLIVGQGIAGSVLSFILKNKGKKVLVIDKGNMDTCSSVAAGLFNPVTGKRMVKTWKASALFPLVHSFYPEMEQQMESSFFHSKNIYRPFGSIEEQNHWISQSTGNEEGFVKTQSINDQLLQPYIQNKFGGFETMHSGNVHVKTMLAAIRKHLQSSNQLDESMFDFEDLQVHADKVLWKDKFAGGIIFCEGYLAIANPYFNWIPFSPSKGEILMVKIPGLPTDVIINKNLFIVPWGNDTFKVGATFERTTELGTSEKGKAELIERLGNLIKLPFEVVGQEAGIRPSVPDRRPLVGVHPEHSNVFMFNGLGTKGVSLAPYFGLQFAEFLSGKGDLDPEINIQRYYSLYFDKK